MGRAFNYSAEYPSQEIAVITKIKPVISGTTTLKCLGGEITAAPFCGAAEPFLVTS